MLITTSGADSTVLAPRKRTALYRQWREA